VSAPNFQAGDVVRLHVSGYLADVVKPLRASVVAKSQPYSIRVRTAKGPQASWALETDMALVERPS
jgi:hypothetical protein